MQSKVSMAQRIKTFITTNTLSITLSILFLIIYLINQSVGDNLVFNALSGSGFHKLNGQFYRLLTASFLHASLLHLVGNILALICVGTFIEKALGTAKAWLVYICSDIIASLMFYGYMNECTGGNGSSIVLYALFAILLVLWLRYPQNFSFKWYNPALIYLILFFFIANLLSGSYTTIIIHAFSFCTGLIMGLLLIKFSSNNL